MKKIVLALAAASVTASSFAQVSPLWLRNPAISPDGKTIIFGYKGDLYKVATSGGTATPLTISESQEMMPVWSHDGKTIAFASDRYGNFDVFAIPASGGNPTRLTYNSSADFPFDFSPDNKKVLFASARNAPANSVRFNSAIFKNLYQVSVSGGRPVLVTAAGAENGHFNKDGSQLVFQDIKGYEDPLRKHHTSAVTHDVWIFDFARNTYKQISTYAGEDEEPVFSNDNQNVYYLSEQKGTMNVFKHSLISGAEEQLTHFTDNPVRQLSISEDNTLAFNWNGEIYTVKEGQQPQKVSIQISNENRENAIKSIPVMGNVNEFVLSPNGKEIAYVNRGEVFVSSIEGKFTKRITNTPSQERMVQWSPDSKEIIYSAERNGNWDVYKTTIVSKDEPYFSSATLLKETPIIATDKDEFEAQYAPDGKSIAYVEERNILKVYNVATKKTITLLPEGHNFSYSDGDWGYSWSPDSKWIITDDQEGYFGSSNAALIKADGTGKIVNPINSGFGESDNKWGLNGKLFTWVSNKLGRKSLAIQGSSELDIYAAFFDTKAFDEYNLSKDDYTLYKEQSDKSKDTTTTPKKEPQYKGIKKFFAKPKDTTVAKSDTTMPEPNLVNIDQRIVRLTINSSSISDYVLNKDASKLYYLASFEKGFDLWVTEPRTHDTRILAKLGGSPSGLEISKDDKSIFVSSNGSLVKIDAESGKVEPISINAEMTLDHQAERKYMFEHIWNQVVKKFYDPKFTDVDWKKYHDVYVKFLPYINNNYDFQQLLSELLGELNASHTGGRYRAAFPNSDATAALGLLYDEKYTGKGLKISDVIAGGPFDKANTKVKAGDIITAIDGADITDSVDWASLLNRKAGDITAISIQGKANVTVRPISKQEETGLLYQRWIKKMEKMVDSLSGGKVGYVHVEGMDDGSFREAFDQVMGKMRDKQALIVDTRFNGGGWLHDDLNTFLSGKNYLKFAPQGHLTKGGEPASRWQKPSCVVMSEGNYSDAFLFPYTYKEQNIGKLIGMPVPGTGTAVWWEYQIDPSIIFGIPMVATIGQENRPTENLQLEPDIRTPLKYEDFLNGKDDQIEAAVKEMLKEIQK